MQDLSEIRAELDNYGEIILRELKERSRLESNTALYVPDGTEHPGSPGTSFLEYALTKKEEYYASIGRQLCTGESQIIPRLLPGTSQESVSDESNPSAAQIDLGQRILCFYTRLVPKMCLSRDSTANYGACLDLDTALLEDLYSRINIGKRVAQAKIEANPKILEVAHDCAQVREYLINKRREEEVIAKARKEAQCLGFDQNLAAHVFAWLIKITTCLEVEYIQALSR